MATRVKYDLLTFATLALVAAILIFCVTYFTVIGMPASHDGNNHVARFAQYWLALKSGQLPPRWAPSLVNGFGYPVFILNYPLSNIASIPLHLMGFSFLTSFAVLNVAYIVIGSIGIWFWMRRLFKNMPLCGVLIAITTYLTNLYVINVLFIRGSIGELAAYALFPWLLYSSDKLVRSRRIQLSEFILSVLCISMFLLSHNLLAVIGVLLLCIWNLILYRPLQTVLLRLVVLVVTGFAITASFWIPALSEASHTVLLETQLNREAYLHLVSPSQLLEIFSHPGQSYPGMVDSISLGLGISLIFGLGLSLLYLVARLAKKQLVYSTSVNVFLTSCAVSIILIIISTTISRSLWTTFEKVQIIQFPWRLAAFIAIFSLPAISLTFIRLRRWIQLTFVVIIACWSVIQLRLYLQLLHPLVGSDIQYLTFSESTSTKHENMPKGFDSSRISDWPKTLSSLEGTLRFSNEVIRGSSKNYLVSSTQGGTVIEPTAACLGWQTTIDGKKVEYVDSMEIGGRIAYVVPPGDHHVRTVFSEQAGTRPYADAISAVAWIVLLLLAGRVYIKRSRSFW